MIEYFEIRWHGRGGQGTVTGAKSLAEAVQGTGKCVSAFPDYEWAEQSGFSVETETGAFRGRCRIGIKAVTKTNQSHYIEKEVHLEDPPEMKEKVRLELLEEIEKALSVPAFPVQSYIEVTTACNLACIMCRNERIQGKQVPWNLFLDKALFLKLKPIFPHLIKANLNGWGEPTLHKDYAEFIKIIRNSFKRCQINKTAWSHTCPDRGQKTEKQSKSG